MEEKSPSRRQVDSRRLLSIVGPDCGMGMKGPAARGQRSTLNKRTETKTWRDKISCEKSRRRQKDKLVGAAPAVVRRLSAQTVHSATTTGARMAGHAIICMGGTTTYRTAAAPMCIPECDFLFYSRSWIVPSRCCGGGWVWEHTLRLWVSAARCPWLCTLPTSSVVPDIIDCGQYRPPEG